MSELLETRDLVAIEPPKRWVNRFRLARFVCATAECAVCGLEQHVTMGGDFVGPHCLPFPSRDIAETMAAQDEAVWSIHWDYLGAEPAP